MSELAARPRPAPEAASPPPAAAVKKKRGISLVWLVPIVAGAIAAWLAWTSYANQGPRVRLTFESAEGLEAGKTKVKYRDVDVGTVESISISSDLAHIIVNVEMVQGATPYLTTNTRFWIVRPRIGTGGVSGLGTLVSGAYIEIDPGKGGNSKRDFAGLEEPPEIRSNVPGRSFVLRADSLGSVARGAPIFYRGIDVGQVLGYELATQNRDALTINVFVRAPYDTLVHAQTRFWNASGISVSTDGGGVSLKLASLQSLLIGGIEFETPAAFVDGEAAPVGTEFVLFEDAAAATDAGYTRREPVMVEFASSTRGLRPGAPVEIRGIRVGSVRDVRLAVEGQTLLTQVAIDLERERVQAVDARTGEPRETLPMEGLIERGLQAQLKTGSLLTGDLFIDLDFSPETTGSPTRQVGGVPLIPSAPTQLETIQASASAFLEKIAALPLPELVQSLTSTAKGLEALVGTPETKDAVANLSMTLASLRVSLDAVNQQAGPLVGSLKATSDAAAAALRQAQGTFASLGPNSPLGNDLRGLVSQLDDAARSIRVLADYLERHPEALVRGKQGGYQ
jgi:paraquat-inducible protein B